MERKLSTPIVRDIENKNYYMNNEFESEWEETIKHFTWLNIELSTTLDKIKKFREKSKEQLKPNKDWEIFAFKAASTTYQPIYRMYVKKEDGRFWFGNDPNNFDEEFCLKMVNEKRHFSEDIWSIHSVRRLTDNLVFSVGDSVDIRIGAFNTGMGGNGWQRHTGEITKFNIVYGEMFIECGTCSGSLKKAINLNQYKAKQPLFTTEDGKEIFEGDQFWWVDTDIWTWGWSIAAPITNKQYFDNHKIFYNGVPAEEYMLMNKPMLSVNDILSISTVRNDMFMQNTKQRLLELAKQKINQ